MTAGLTGGIGTGKTVVARLFAMMGCKVFSSDNAAKEVYYEDEVRGKVKLLLGDKAYLSDSSIDKAYISSRIYSNTMERAALNAIIHPAVRHVFEKFVAAHPDDIIIKESALLFEADLHKELDCTVVVTCSDRERIRRVALRDGLSPEEVMQRISSQMPMKEKEALADHVIVNDGHKAVIPQVEAVYEILKKKAGQ